MSYIVKKSIQEFAKKNNVKVSKEFYDALDKKVELLLKRANKRCLKNKRKTLMAFDV